MHHPDHGAEVAQARRLGGVHRRKEATLMEVYDLGDLGTIGGARRLLSIVALETLALPNSVPRNQTLVAVAKASVKVIEAADIADILAPYELPRGPDRRRG